MVSLVLILVAVSSLLSVPAWHWSKKQHQLFPWDYGLPVYPLLMWFLLVELGIGPQSLSNLVELFIVSAFAVGVVYLRAFVFHRLFTNAYASSMMSIVMVLVCPVILRLTMPHLPE
jgi:hypothetical protein